jgi:NAD(P)-dependent dehydrogenase (short-subunit alcohol dehydrogenase family)
MVADVNWPTAAFTVSPAWAAYAASKAAVEMLARIHRIELAPTGATVGVAHFGLINTALVREFEIDPLTIPSKPTPETLP